MTLRYIWSISTTHGSMGWAGDSTGQGSYDPLDIMNKTGIWHYTDSNDIYNVSENYLISYKPWDHVLETNYITWNNQSEQPIGRDKLCQYSLTHQISQPPVHYQFKKMKGYIRPCVSCTTQLEDWNTSYLDLQRLSFNQTQFHITMWTSNHGVW